MFQILYSTEWYYGKKYTPRRKAVICLGVEYQVPFWQENTYICLKAFTKQGHYLSGLDTKRNY